MGVAATELLHSFLMVLNRLPGKQALLFVPLAFGYSKLDPKFCSSKADAQAPASPAAAAPSSGSGAHTTAAVTDSALPGPLGVLATQLMGQNQFASVSVRLCLIPAKLVSWPATCKRLQTPLFRTAALLPLSNVAASMH